MSGPVTSRSYRWQPIPMMLSTVGLIAAGVLVALFTSALATGYMVLGPRPALPVALRSRGW